MTKKSSVLQPPLARNTGIPTAAQKAEIDRLEREAAEEQARAEAEAEEQAEQERIEREAQEQAEQENEEREEQAELNKLDFFTRMENINDELEAAGVKIDGEMKFIIERRNPTTTQYKYCRTYHNNFPDLDAIGKDLGGGDYSVKVHAPSKKDGRMRYCKYLKFSIDPIDYPIKLEKPVETAAPVVAGTDPALLELIRQGQVRSDEAERRHQELMAKQGSGSNLKELIEIMTAFKALNPPQVADTVNPAKVIDQLGTMLKTGMDMAFEMQNRKDEKSFPEMAMGLLERALEKIDLGSALGAAVQHRPAIAPTPQAPAGNNSAQPAARQDDPFVVLNETFAEIILGYDNIMPPHPITFAEKIRKLPRLAPVLKWALSMTPDQVVDVLTKKVKQGPLVVKLQDPDFVDYLKEILDCVRDYDIIIGVDEETGDVIKKSKDVPINENGNGNGKPAAEKPAGEKQEPEIPGNEDHSEDTQE